ncbi:MAG: undecaprenyl/decaprenyl-phosphate alpha-N-acetylglucosaminyl 1-phosphate transferase [Treponema sp.]|jgi:UDP-GlcNAc:undecaprenyl-phosphate GlcNAc-1-phosphate transferase|nr:undecaprenyl/decaprenyl-phosphate alpha-N-acetylglucosaminyl 1-phosphate transferase [Treponema sp.]
MIFEVLIFFAATAVFSTALVALILRLSHHKSWYDHVNERKVHSGDVPRLGGFGFSLVFIAFAVIIVAFVQTANLGTLYLPCFAGVLIIVIFGVWDDFRPMKSLVKLLIQVVAALCVIRYGFTFKRILFFDGDILEKIPWLGYALTFLWIVGLTNAINLIDGVDGLAGGMSAIIALAYALVFFQGGERPMTLLCICLAGSIFGFLAFNAPIPRAKIFMGDGGSQFLGFTLSLMPLLSVQTTSQVPLMYAAALLVIPIFDTTAAVWRRVRDKKRIDQPDRAHIHHKLMNLGFSHPKIDATLLGLQLFLSVLVFVSLQFQNWLSHVILGFAYLSALVFFAALHFLNRNSKLIMDDADGFSPPRGEN